MRLTAAAVLLVLLSPLAGIAVQCGCPVDACLLHHRPSAPVGHASCHEAPAESGPSCALVAPCRHSAGATPVLALPPAILAAATAAPVLIDRGGAILALTPADSGRSARVSTPPPRFPAV